MKSIKRALCALLAVLLLCALSACGKKDEAAQEASEDLAALVQGKLDSLYLGQAGESYLAAMGVTEADCLREYQENLEINAEYFALRPGPLHRGRGLPDR